MRTSNAYHRRISAFTDTGGVFDSFSRQDLVEDMSSGGEMIQNIDPYMGVSGHLISLLQDAAESLRLDPALDTSAEAMMSTVMTM